MIDKRPGFVRERRYDLMFGLISLLLFAGSVNAQTFQTRDVKLYDYFNRFYIQEVPIEVTGLPNVLNDSFGLEAIQLSLHHDRTSDLKIQLQAPDGTTVWVTNRNGGLDGKDYINTRFSQYGKNGLINAGRSSFTGNYIPDGQMTYFNNGSNPNGTWKLLVEDLTIGVEGILDSVGIIFGNKPAHIVQRKYCSMLEPELCSCPKKGCELLPDLVIVPAITKTQYLEFANNDSMYPGQLKIAVAIANIGLGPLEVGPDSSLIGNCCGSDTIKMSPKARFDLFQKIYSKAGKGFVNRTVKTGTIYYESMPGHHHYHVDDWIEMRLVKMVNGQRKLMCKGAKVSYCLFTNGMLYEKEKSSLINGVRYGTTMPNYALGEYPACSLAKQGIAVGGYDYYGMMYEGQYLQLPKGLKSGEYILEIEIDPDHKYIESDRSNNIFKIKINIKKQQK